MFAKLTERLLPNIIGIAAGREPDLVIGERAAPYMLRWWVIPRNRYFNIYLHHFLRSDDDRAHHDHPWWNLSWLLHGAYTEHTIEAGGVHLRTRRVAGELKLRGAKAAHRIELTDGPCWTLFITGPVFRNWGFHCSNGWRRHEDFVQVRPGGNQVGLGCD